MKRSSKRMICALAAALALLLPCAGVAATDTGESAVATPSGGLWQPEIVGIPVSGEEAGEPAPYALEEGPSLYANAPTDEPANASQLYFYNRMTERQKTVYRAFYYIMRTYGVDYIAIDPALGVSVAELNSITCACTFDNPEMYWSSAAFYYNYAQDDPATQVGDRIVTGVALYDDTTDNRPENETVALGKAQEMQAAADRLLAGVPIGPPAVMALQIHDALARHVTYDYEAIGSGIRKDDYMPHTAYNALTQGLAVCDGYAKAYLYLLRQRGITASVVTSSDHAWNIVQLGSDLYEVDVTGDDQESNGIIYNYFNQTTANMLGHTRTTGEGNIFLPEATGTHFTQSYLSWNGRTIQEGHWMGVGLITLALNPRPDGYMALGSMREAAVWKVALTEYNSGTYTRRDSIIWKVEALLPAETVLTLDTPWSESSPVVTFGRLLPPTGTSSDFSLSIVFDNGAIGSASGSLNAFSTLPNGDPNADGVVNIKDAVFAKRIFTYTVGSSSLEKFNADVNIDGKVNDADVEIILRRAALA